MKCDTNNERRCTACGFVTADPYVMKCPRCLAKIPLTAGCDAGGCQGCKKK
ncbi:MAG: hypothetical protein ACYC1U_03950 [Candidatus Aquicultorales bacterium]